MQQEPTIPQPANTRYAPPQSNPVTPPSKKKSKEGWKSVASTVVILIAAPLVAVFLTSFVFQSYEVDGPSMQQTLQNKDRLIVWKVPQTFARITNKNYIPNRGDVVVFVKRGIADFGEHPDKQLIKRVIGLPGDRVVVQDNVILVYNKENPQGFNPDTTLGYGTEPLFTPGTVDITVPEGEVFVSGDNRTNSLDSRAFGTISSDDIIGKLVVRIFPVNKAKAF